MTKLRVSAAAILGIVGAAYATTADVRFRF